MHFNLNEFWKSTTDVSKFKLYSTEHILSLLIIFFIIALIYFFRKNLRSFKCKKIIGYILSTTLFLQQSLLYIWYMDSDNFTLKESLPLYTCRISAILCIFMIVNGSHKLFDIVYFWGVGGASIALLNPDTSGFVFPHIMFVQFFVGHGCIFICIFFMIFVYEYTLDFNSLKNVFRWTLLYLILVGCINYLVDGNYSYLRAKPITGSPLDYLPPYPYYVPIFVSFVFLLFILLYTPFYFYSKKKLKNISL